MPRTIQRLIESEFTDLLNGDIEPGHRVTVGLTQGDLHFDVERGGAREEVSD